RGRRARETAPQDLGAAGRREGERRRPSMRRERGSVRPKPPAGRPPEPARRAQPLRWLRHPAALSAVLALALYWPATGGGFVWDDHWLVESNPALRAPREAWSGGLVRPLLSDFWAPTGSASGYWRPLVVLSYRLDGALSHWTAGWFHAVNLVLHAGTSATVAALAAAAGAGTLGSLAAGAWFASSPAH